MIVFTAKLYSVRTLGPRNAICQLRPMIKFDILAQEAYGPKVTDCVFNCRLNGIRRTRALLVCVLTPKLIYDGGTQNTRELSNHSVDSVLLCAVVRQSALGCREQRISHRVGVLRGVGAETIPNVEAMIRIDLVIKSAG